MSNIQDEDPFFRLLKDPSLNSTNRLFTPKKQVQTLLPNQFKMKTSIFQQRITPTEMQKKEIIKDILENNINYIYNTEVLPQENAKIHILDRVDMEPIFNEKPSDMNKDDQIDIVAKPELIELEITPPKQPEEFPLKFHKHKERQPTLGELFSKQKVHESKKDNDDDNVEISSLKVREYKMSDIKPPVRLPKPSKEDKLAKLKDELKAMSSASKKREEEIQEEIRRKAAEAAKQNAEKLKQYKLKMIEDREKRMESLLMSNGQMITSSVGAINQAINKQRKNIDPLIKFFLSHKYYEQKMFSVPNPVPNEFDDYIDYQRTFQPLMMNEYIANIQNNIESLTRDKSGNKCKKCTLRLCNKQEEEEEEYTIIELQESKDSEEGDQIISYQNKNVSEIFDLTFAKNYLVLICSSKNFSVGQVNREDYKNEFAIMGYLNTSEKTNARETPKVQIMVNYSKFKKCLKKEWNTCYVRPVEKITTFLREYISLNCFVCSDVNQYIFKPRGASNILNPDNMVLYKKFFNNIKVKYNEGQLAAIKDVCLSRNGICLLQGPPGTGKTHTLVGIVSGLYHHLKSGQNSHRRHIMICAPSNTAIDEIILRIKQNGLFGENGEIIRPNVVRVGVLDREPHDLVKQCALENLAQKEMQRLKNLNKSGMSEATMNEIRDEIAKISKRIQNEKSNSSCDKKALDGLYDKRRELYEKFRDYKAIKMGEKETYNQIIESILHTADVICCTLTSAGSEKLERFKDYIEAVIVDEASQCIEPSNIIPLQYSPKKLILIGDPKQLPAITFSNDAQTTRFNRSLFERILDSGVKAFFLYEQYRMVSSIRKFPSLQFYEDRLTDSASVQQRKFPSYLSNLQSRNVLFVDLQFSRESVADHSYYNNSEINVCVGILEILLQRLNAGAYGGKHAIGCISPYKRQILLLNERLREKYGNDFRDNITVNTVDAFQGQEKDVILFSTVRASVNAASGSDERNLIGFLNDVRRMNVAITRPKFVLIVIGIYALGNSMTLSTNETWRTYIDYLVQNQCYVNVPAAQEIDRVIQMLYKNERFPLIYTKPPDLPIITPKKTKKEIKADNTKSEELETPKKIASRHNLDYAPAMSLLSSFDLSATASLFNKPRQNSGTTKRDRDNIVSEYSAKQQMQVLESDEESEKIQKKRKVDQVPKQIKPNEELMVVENNSCNNGGGIGSLFGKRKEEKTPAYSGLSSLFSKTPEKKEPEASSSILSRFIK